MNTWVGYGCTKKKFGQVERRCGWIGAWGARWNHRTGTGVRAQRWLTESWYKNKVWLLGQMKNSWVEAGCGKTKWAQRLYENKVWLRRIICRRWGEKKIVCRDWVDLGRTRPTLSLYKNKVWSKVMFIQAWPGPKTSTWAQLDQRWDCMKIRFSRKLRSYKLDEGPSRRGSRLYENKV